MATVDYTWFKKRMTEYFALVEDETVIIRRSDGQERVLLSKQEYDSLLATGHLLSTPTNIARLHLAVAEIDAEIARRSDG
jgi:PHD/YefM family antitoxin component YafN of YafNO toxin-antitoxin module